MAIRSDVKRLLALGTVMVLLMVGLVSGGDTVSGSDREGDSPGEAQNKVREDYCAATAVECGSFCFWAQCNECPICCDSNCDCDISGEHACASKGEFPSCGMEVEYEDCDTDEDGSESCSTYTVCESCGTTDCATGCCGWTWWMYQQANNTTLSLSEKMENPRLETAVNAAVTEPRDIQDCVADGGRVDRKGTTAYEGTVPTATVLYTPEWYGTREPVPIPRKLPVVGALHEYPGTAGAPVLQDVQQDPDDGKVTLVTNERWELLEYRAWPYGGRVPNDQLPDIDEPVLGLPGFPQRSLLSQWKSLPEDGILPEPKMVFHYEMFDWSNSDDFTMPWANNGTLGGLFPSPGQLMMRNYYDWGMYAFQIRRAGEPGRSNTRNALLHLGLEAGSNPCPAHLTPQELAVYGDPDVVNPESNICGFRVNMPEDVPLGLPPGSQGFGGLKVSGVSAAWTEAELLETYYPSGPRPAGDWFYGQVADYGMYRADSGLLRQARESILYRVETPEVHPSFSAQWAIHVDPITDLMTDDVEMRIGQFGGALSNGWVDVRFWPHSGTLSSQTSDHKWYSLGRVQGQTLSLVEDYDGILRCWQYRSDNFSNIETQPGCRVDEDAASQDTESLMPFSDAAYEVFRNWRNWNFQIRVVEEVLDHGVRVGFISSSPSEPVVVRMQDPADQVLEFGTLDVITPAERPHTRYVCTWVASGISNQLVNQYGSSPAPSIFAQHECSAELEFQSFIDVDLSHPGAASELEGALEEDTPAWRYLQELRDWVLLH